MVPRRFLFKAHFNNNTTPAPLPGIGALCHTSQEEGNVTCEGHSHGLFHTNQQRDTFSTDILRVHCFLPLPVGLVMGRLPAGTLAFPTPFTSFLTAIIIITRR